MRFIEDLCPPALLYLIFLVVQVGLDVSLGLWITLLIKFVLGIAVVIVLDMFCSVDLGVVSWFLVAAPFLITALGTAIAIGTNFDAWMMESVKEQFLDASVKTDDLPADSNTITSKK
jgi:hypothetical protein